MATLVFLEHHEGEFVRNSLGVLSKAAALGGDVAGVIAGSGVRDLAAQAGEYGAARVYVADDPALEAPLPAVVAVSDAINEPRYPSLKGIMAAKSKPHATLTAEEVGGAEPARTTVLALAAPPERGERVRIDDAAAAPEAIVEFLVERRLL